MPSRSAALLEAALALGSEHELEPVLRRIVESATAVVGARYGALGRYDEHGEIQAFVHVGVDAGTVARIGRLPRGRGLLGEVIVARPHLGGNDIPPIRETSNLGSGALATGEQTGTNVAIDPLEPERGLDGGAWVMLAVSLGLILLGAWLALRWQPLRHREA